MRYEVKVRFHEDFVKADGTCILVGITSKPERGKANAELIRKLAKHFSVPSSRVRILTGHKSKSKIVEIT
ncbi:MAG: DUF167 domain-containing protein [Candidatus Bathyarchaeota archaeon]|nr:DUF167 domain-containing protein [Candidatus Bathyarchaeota archaeon]